jgi:hypothetical protein
MLRNGVGGIKFCLDRIFVNYDLNNPFEKSNAWKEVEAFARDMRPMIAQAIIKDAAKVLGVVRPTVTKEEPRRSFSGNMREFELIKYAVTSGDDNAIKEILSAEKCFSAKDEIEALKRLEFDHELLSRIFLDDTIHMSTDFDSDMLIFKQWCLKRFIAAVTNSNTISPVDKLKKIREAQSKINEMKEKEMHDW